MKFSVLLSDIKEPINSVTSIAGSSLNKDDITKNIYFEVKDNQLILKANNYNIEMQACVSLKNVEIFKHMIGGSSGAEDGMAVVAVCTVNLYLLTVDVYDSVLDFNGAEADVLNDVLLAALDNERVKLRILVAPESGVSDEHFKCTASVKRD